VTKFLLDAFPLKKLQIINHKRIDAAKSFLESDRGLVLQCRDEAIHEFFRGEITYTPTILFACPCN